MHQAICHLVPLDMITAALPSACHTLLQLENQVGLTKADVLPFDWLGWICRCTGLCSASSLPKRSSPFQSCYPISQCTLCSRQQHSGPCFIRRSCSILPELCASHSPAKGCRLPCTIRQLASSTHSHAEGRSDTQPRETCLHLSVF